jgi:prepilin-type N-terminal cleavage/methylation domain-containing protein/prepilin-type processing-associated H-X9-DG protein
MTSPGIARAPAPSPTDRRRRGFTLMELLVVVAIIALLVAILIPSLGAARRLARTSACAANLRGIGQLNAVYASEFDDYIMGGQTTSGRFLITFDNAFATDPTGAPYGDNNCPSINATDDWMTPALRLQNQMADSENGPSAQARAARVIKALNSKIFICPSNNVTISVYNPGSGASAANAFMPASFLMPSYNTAGIFYWYPPNTHLPENGLNLVTVGSLVTAGSGTLAPPSSYSPRIGRVGATAGKIFMGDAARFSKGDKLPDLELQPKWSADYAPHYESFSPMFKRDYGWLRDAAPGNSSPSFDNRTWWARHGAGGKIGAKGDFRANFVFFDAHVETLNDLAACNPAYWMPSGSTYNTTSNAAQTFQLQPDVAAKWFPGAGAIYTAP